MDFTKKLFTYSKLEMHLRVTYCTLYNYETSLLLLSYTKVIKTLEL